MISALIPALHLDSRLVFRKHSATKWNANEEVGKLGYPVKKFMVAIFQKLVSKSTSYFHLFVYALMNWIMVY